MFCLNNFERKKHISQKNFPAARAIYSWISLGGDATENGDFQKKKQRLEGYKKFWMAKFSWISSGDDATENGDFQRRKQRLQGYKIFQISFYLHKELIQWYKIVKTNILKLRFDHFSIWKNSGFSTSETVDQRLQRYIFFQSFVVVSHFIYTKGGDVIENFDFRKGKSVRRGTFFYRDLILLTQRLQH